MMSAHRVGSALWYEANPDAPSRAEAEADAAFDRRHPTPVTPEVKAWLDEAEQRRRENQRLDAEWAALDLPF